MVEWDSDHRDCADLRGGGSLFAADCDEYGPWACKKEYWHAFETFIYTLQSQFSKNQKVNKKNAAYGSKV